MCFKISFKGSTKDFLILFSTFPRNTGNQRNAAREAKCNIYLTKHELTGC